MSSKTSPLPEAWQGCQFAPPDHEEASEGQPASVSELLTYTPELRTDSPAVWEYPESDDGNAAFFLSHLGHLLRWIPETKLWAVFHKGRWHNDTTGRSQAFCQYLSRHQLLAADALKKDLAEQIASQVIASADALSDSPPLNAKEIKTRVRMAQKRAQSLGDEKTISSLLQAASHNGAVIVPAGDWDANPWVIGLRNGILDLKNQRHRDGRASDLVTRCMAVDFDSEATCPEWEKFITRIMPDAEVALYLQKICGYFLTGSCDDQAFYFFYGDGKNGKSILVRTLAAVFGTYGAKARHTLVEENRFGADPKADLAQLPGVRFLYGEETREGAKLNEAIVKSLVAGDPLTGEAKYAAPFVFTPEAKLVMMGNHKPKIAGTDTGIWRRVRLIPFTQVITEEEAIPPTELLARFAAESSGILNWMLEGLALCPPGAIPMPQSIENAVAEYRQGEDDLGDFLEECTQDAAPGYKVKKLEIFQRYQEWAEENGIRHTLTQKQLTRKLGERPGWVMDPRRDSWVAKSTRSSP